MASRYDANTNARAVRLVREHGGDYDTRWGGHDSMSARLGVSVEALREWVRQDEVDAARRPECRWKPPVSCASLAARTESLSQRNPQGRDNFLRAGCDPAT
ncbi:MAG: hypothetical protein JOZ49_13945 [Mycolicibacterium sp.]|nr:hypothetical protein [Mycolicibacterium sp.]